MNTGFDSSHIVCRTTAARAVAKINNGCKHFAVDVRDEDQEHLYADRPNMVLSMFSTQVTNRIVELLAAASPEARLESITITLPQGHLRLEGQLA